jgi:class 3 adenylate cyclase
MEFRILGPLEVRDVSGPVPIAGAKQRALLAILLLNANRVVSRDRLIDALWEDQPPDTARKAVQVHVSQLRKVLGSDRILTRAPGYLIRVDPGELDLDEFERLVAEGGRDRLREALALFREPPLADLGGERFAQSEIARLEELRLVALEERIDADLALGRHAELVPELETLVTEHPLRERLRAQLMLALYRCARQAESLAVYQDARRVLVEELGIDPSRALQELERAILVQDAALDLPPAVAPQPAADVPPPAPGPPRADERKMVTVLFADLVGSTELGEDDPERVRALLERVYDAMDEEIGRAGGTVEKFAGDSVLAAFGAPTAQEDHAERALHAAVAIRERVREQFGGTVSLRIGVNTGEVVVGRPRAGSSFVTGDAVNVAARLEEAAEAGQIVVGERTATLAGGAFEFDDAVVVEAKGKREGVVCRALRRAISLARPRGVSGIGTTFVGRGRELELLHASYRAAVATGEAGLVTIAGEPGVGKTTLVQAFWERLAGETPEPLRRIGRCPPYGAGITYRPLADVLKEHLGILESDQPRAVWERLAGREILGVTLGLPGPSGLHPLLARERLHQAWVELLEEVVAEQPAVVLIEDLHWAEEPLLDLVARLRRDVAGPLFVIATARPELLERTPGWGTGRGNTSVVWLEPLPPEETAHMLEQLLAAELPARLRELVVETAEGNPFFVEELLSSLIDRGVLERVNGDWRVHEPRAGFALPDSVQSLVAARIDLLAAAEKSALQAASVVGRVFWAGPVAELLEDVGVDFGRLEERDFIRRRPRSSIAGEHEFAFKHALTREVAYASLPKAKRARLHAGVAAWLERLGEGRDEHALLLAHHYAEAVRPEYADLAWSGEDHELGRLQPRALAWLRRAADLAAGRYALDEQISLLQRAVELEPSDAGRAELWHTLARANVLKFDHAAFRTAMLSAIDASSDRAGDLFSELAFWEAFRFGHTEDRVQIERWIERALDLAAPQSAGRARALIARSYCVPEDAETAAQEAVALAERLPDVELRSYAFHACADSALAEGRYDEARGWAERRIELLNEIDDPDHTADVYWSAIPGYLAQGRFDDARRLAQLHDEVTSELSPHHKLHGVAFLLEVEELAADWQRIRELTPRAERAVEASTRCIHQPRSLVVCALAAAALGDDEEAGRLEGAADSLGVEEYGRVVDTRIRLALLRGDLAVVERLLAQSEAPDKSLIRSSKVAPVAARLDALAALGRRERVESEAPELLRPETYLEPFALRALGVVRDDERMLEEAAARFEAMDLHWHAVQTRTAGIASG